MAATGPAQASSGGLRNAIACATGFTCLMPGISLLNIAGIGLQPTIPLLCAYALVFPLARLRMPVQPAIWTLGNVAVLLAACAASGLAGSLGYGLYHCLLVAAAGLGIGAMLAVPHDRVAFVDGYVAGAVVSAGLGMLQAAFTGLIDVPLLLANNENFSNLSAAGRASAFTPEASVLAGLLLPALACIWFERFRPDSSLARPLRGRWALAVVAGGLLATRSSSLLAAPVVLAATALFLEASWRPLRVSVMRLMVLAALLGTLFLPLYIIRTGDNDDAAWSRAWRTLKITTGLEIFAQNPVLGAGPGYVSDAQLFQRHLRIPPEMSWMTGEPRKGVDSTPVRILAETGALGFLLAYYPLVLFLRRARFVAADARMRPLLTLCVPLVYAQTVALGYRDLIAMLLPAVAFSLAGGMALLRRPARLPAVAEAARTG